MTENTESSHSRPIIPAKLAIRSMRDNGYKNTAHALAELIDNAIQAEAKTIEVICCDTSRRVRERNSWQTESIAVLDNGTGMTQDELGSALQFGNGKYLENRRGIGRFGMGLPNASISQARRVEVYSWKTGPEHAWYSYLDVDMIISGDQSDVPEPEIRPVPVEWRSKGTTFGTSGTLVVWSTLEPERLNWKGAEAILKHTELTAGRLYRRFIHEDGLIVKLRALRGDDIVKDDCIKVNDPLYLMSNSCTSEPYNDRAMFREWNQEAFPIELNGDTYTVVVRTSVALEETVPSDGKDRGNKPYGQDARHNIGLSVVRARRELELDRNWANDDTTERWWGAEVEFPAALDEIFGVINNKQAAINLSQMANYDWQNDAEGEGWQAYKARVLEEDGHRAQLIKIAEHIKKQITEMRKHLERQTQGRGSPGRRHAKPPSVENKATSKLRKRAVAHPVESDQTEFQEEDRPGFVEDLVEKKQYAEESANNLASRIIREKWRIVFLDASEKGWHFFNIEEKPGLIEVIFNRDHPAYNSLVKVLEAGTEQQTAEQLAERLQNAYETFFMLFAAWARQEIEDVPGRKELWQIRSDWGKMAWDFLTDEDQ